MVPLIAGAIIDAAAGFVVCLTIKPLNHFFGFPLGSSCLWGRVNRREPRTVMGFHTAPQQSSQHEDHTVDHAARFLQRQPRSPRAS
jgi:hypothetical protein